MDLHCGPGILEGAKSSEMSIAVTLICVIIPDAAENTQKPKHYTEVSRCLFYEVVSSSLKNTPFRVNAMADIIRL